MTFNSKSIKAMKPSFSQDLISLVNVSKLFKVLNAAIF